MRIPRFVFCHRPITLKPLLDRRDDGDTSHPHPNGRIDRHALCRETATEEVDAAPAARSRQIEPVGAAWAQVKDPLDPIRYPPSSDVSARSESRAQSRTQPAHAQAHAHRPDKRRHSALFAPRFVSQTNTPFVIMHSGRHSYPSASTSHGQSGFEHPRTPSLATRRDVLAGFLRTAPRASLSATPRRRAPPRNRSRARVHWNTPRHRSWARVRTAEPSMHDTGARGTRRAHRPRAADDAAEDTGSGQQVGGSTTGAHSPCCREGASSRGAHCDTCDACTTGTWQVSVTANRRPPHPHVDRLQPCSWHHPLPPQAPQ